MHNQFYVQSFGCFNAHFVTINRCLKIASILFSVEHASLRFLDGDTTIQEKTADGLATTRKTDLLCFETDPEIKRRIIGDTFMEVAKKVGKRLEERLIGIRITIKWNGLDFFGR